MRCKYDTYCNSRKTSEFPTITILKHVNVWAKVNKSPLARLQNMTPHDAYSITINVRKMTISYISNKKKE